MMPPLLEGNMSDAKSQVQAPAIALMVTAALGGCLQVFNILGALFGFNQTDPADLEPLLAELPSEQADMILAFVENSSSFGVVFNLIGLLLAAVVFFAAWQMMQLKGHALAIGGSVVAMIPCLSPCCCLGLPIGIWALIILLKPEVKEGFDQGLEGLTI